MTIYPNKLKKNDSIGIIAPSSSANLDKIDKAINNIKNLGYKVVEGDLIRNENIKCVSSSAEQRVKEFVNIWNNEDIKYIIGARGGEFLMEILPMLDEIFEKEKLYQNPKWIQGYSDMTTLLFYLTTKYNIATIEMANLGDYAMNPLHESLLVPFNIAENFYENIQNNYPLWQKDEIEENLTYSFNLTEKSKCKLLFENEKSVNFSGRLIGGCLDVVSQYVGTKWDYVKEYINKNPEGIIWHLENCELSINEMYRRLWFMREQGWFENANGFIFGRTYVEENIFDFSYIDAIERALGNLNIPIVYDIDIGHTKPQWTIVNGSLGKIIFDNGKCELIQKFI